MDYLTTMVPAIRGRMGETAYYTANFPFGIAVKIFQFNPDRMPERVEDRHQRALNSERVPEIARYILDHDDYVFSSVTVSVDEEKLEFESSDTDGNVGVLAAPLHADWIINDGQHRLAGIAEALRHRPELKDDTLSVVILTDPGLRRCQQVFSDLNRTVKKTSASLDIAFDHRSALNRLTNAVVDRVPLFRDRTDKERVSLSLRSRAFATLSAVGAAHRQLFGLLPEQLPQDELEAHIATAIEFWSVATEIVTPWQAIADGEVDAPQARSLYLSSYAIALWALASAGRTAIDHADDWRGAMRKLARVDWRKENPDWQGICMVGDEVVTRQPTRRATADHLRWKMKLGPKPKHVLDVDLDEDIFDS